MDGSVAASASDLEECTVVSVIDVPAGSSEGCDITEKSPLVLASDSFAVPTPAGGGEGCCHADPQKKLEEEAVATAPALLLPGLVSFQFRDAGHFLI
jgi:hypothetical protein